MNLLKKMKTSRSVKIYVYTSNVQFVNIKKEDLIRDADEMTGATTFLDVAADAYVRLLV